MKDSSKKSKKKVWKYHISHSYDIETTKYTNHVTFMSQLYQIGIYTIINNLPYTQDNTTPERMVSLEKKLIKSETLGKITNLEFGQEISVTTDENNFYIKTP